ncbi:MAG: hypothetical protein ACPG4N_04495 [Gammaproteobacteria bacterium]
MHRQASSLQSPAPKPLYKRILCALVPDWMANCHPDSSHPHRRRFTPAYRRKVSVVKNIWIVLGLVALLINSLPMTVILGLMATFSSFMVLDECA